MAHKHGAQAWNTTAWWLLALAAMVLAAAFSPLALALMPAGLGIAVVVVPGRHTPHRSVEPPAKVPCLTLQAVNAQMAAAGVGAGSFMAFPWAGSSICLSVTLVVAFTFPRLDAFLSARSIVAAGPALAVLGQLAAVAALLVALAPMVRHASPGNICRADEPACSAFR